MIAIFSSFWTYGIYRETAYEDQEQLVSSYAQRGNYTYTVPVTEINPLYPKGTILEMGKPAYFFAVSPTLDFSFTYAFNASDSADLSVERKTMIVATSHEGSGENKTIFWQKKFPLKHIDAVDIKDKAVLVHNFSLDVPEIQEKIKKVQDQLQYSQDTTVEIVTQVNYEGKINWEDVNGETNFAIPLIIGPSYYQIPEELEFNEVNETYKKFRVHKNLSLPAVRSPLFLFLFSTVMVGMLFFCMRMSKVDQEYIEKLEKEQKYSPFKEFISKGKLPDRNFLVQIDIHSLQDLVDAAVDMNERVIHDAETCRYFFVHNDILYIYFDTTFEK